MLPTRTPLPVIADATASEVIASRRRAALACGIVGTVVALWPAPAPAEGSAAKPIYRCITSTGKAITSDRPMPECRDRDHAELNPDGSIKRIVPPTMTDDERANAEQREREEKVAISTKNDWIRRDRNLVQRYPDEATHRKARTKALDEYDGSVRRYQARIKDLNDERKTLSEKAEFYGPPPKQPMPTLLKTQIDANETSLKVYNQLVLGQQEAINRINSTYDIELFRLKKLWAGAAAGSLGPLPQTGATAADALKSTSTN